MNPNFRKKQGLVGETLKVVEALKTAYDNHAANLTLAQKWALFQELSKYPSIDNATFKMYILFDIKDDYTNLLLSGEPIKSEEMTIFVWAENIINKNPEFAKMRIFNPEKGQQRQKEILRLGHVMGMSGNVGVKVGFNQTVLLGTEGNDDLSSLDYVREKLANYQQQTNDLEWKTILSMFDASRSDLDIKGNLSSIATNEQLRRYHQNEPVHICSGWAGHSIGITLYKGYLIVSNRGEGGDQSKGTQIYKLSNPPTAEQLRALQKNILKQSPTQQEIQGLIRQMHGYSEPLLSFPQKGQEHGTCSYVNKIASTEGLLCLLSLERDGKKLNDQAIEAHPDFYLV